jgi:hypothetical protein
MKRSNPSHVAIQDIILSESFGWPFCGMTGGVTFGGREREKGEEEQSR